MWLKGTASTLILAKIPSRSCNHHKSSRLSCPNSRNYALSFDISTLRCWNLTLCPQLNGGTIEVITDGGVEGEEALIVATMIDPTGRRRRVSSEPYTDLRENETLNGQKLKA